MNKRTNFLLRLFLLPALLLPATSFAQQNFPVAGNDETGFFSIFDGKTFDGWIYNPVYWTIKDGVMTGTVTPETLLQENSFIIWQGGQPRNFELKMDYRVSDKGNSGINYRSVPYTKTGNKYALKGYQLDIDGAGEWTGQNYEEKGREYMALRGEAALKKTGERSQIVAHLESDGDLWNAINKEGWNAAHVIARDGVLIHIINGRVMSIVVDDDVANRTMEGLIGMQVHVGPPMTIEYRNIRLKEIK